MTHLLDPAPIRGYRRAHAIAVASLRPGHPFVTTSLKNLVDFCAAHEIPIWKPAASADDQPSATDPPAEAPPEPMLPVPLIRTWPSRKIAVLSVGAAVIVAVAFAVQGRGTTDSSAPVPQAESGSPANDSPAASVTTPALIGQPQPGSARTRSAICHLAGTCSTRDCRRTRIPLWSIAGTAANEYSRSGGLVAASPGRGYRTFSSNTVSPERAGDWRVELRGADGTVLWEERFVIRLPQPQELLDDTSSTASSKPPLTSPLRPSMRASRLRWDSVEVAAESQFTALAATNRFH